MRLGKIPQKKQIFSAYTKSDINRRVLSEKNTSKTLKKKSNREHF